MAEILKCRGDFCIPSGDAGQSEHPPRAARHDTETPPHRGAHARCPEEVGRQGVGVSAGQTSQWQFRPCTESGDQTRVRTR